MMDMGAFMTDNLPANRQPKATVELLDWVAAGHYVRARRYARSGNQIDVEKGTVLLVESVLKADGEDHTVVLHPHPLEPEYNTRKLLLDAFYATFEPVEHPQTIREDEIAVVQREIADIQADIVAGPSPQDIVDPEIMRALPASNHDAETAISGMTLPAIIANKANIDAMRRAADANLALAKATQKWISERSRMIAERTRVLARFFDERAAAAIGIVEEQIRMAERLQKGVKTLGLYTGENIVVETIREGSGAPVDEPLTLYQRKLFMDEESLMNAAWGGLDFHDFQAFAEQIVADDNLLTRILPAPRSVVVMGYSRQFRDEYATLHPMDIAAIIQANRAGFLLVRNGRNLYRVLAPDVVEDTPRLFPTETEMNKPFRGMDGSHITPDSIEYVGHLDKFRAIELHYKRALVALWGLNDRLGLFGTFWGEEDAPDFMSIDFQSSRFRFIYDDEKALSVSRPNFQAWWNQCNDYLQSGSRTVCRWTEMIDYATAPSCYRESTVARARSHDTIAPDYKPVKAIETKVVYRKEDRLCVDVAVSGYSWRASKDLNFNAKVQIDHPHVPPRSFLVLDMAKLDDLDYYLNSRHERENYLAYVPLFSEARRILLEEREWESPIRSELLAGLVGDTDNEIAGSYIDAAIRQYRAGRRGRPLTRPGQDGYRRDLGKLREIIAKMRIVDDAFATATAAAVRKTGRTPLRLILAGNANLVCYATATNDELDLLPIPCRHARRLSITQTARGLRIDAGPAVTMRTKIAGEFVIKEWRSANSFIMTRPRIDAAQRQAIANAIQASPLDLGWMLAGPGAEWDALFARLTTKIKSASKGRVESFSVRAPIGLVFDGNDDPNVVVIGYEALAWMHIHGDGDQQAKVIHFVRSIYAHPDSHIERITNAVRERPCIHSVRPGDPTLSRASGDGSQFTRGGMSTQFDADRSLVDVVIDANTRLGWSQDDLTDEDRKMARRKAEIRVWVSPEAAEAFDKGLSMAP